MIFLKADLQNRTLIFVHHANLIIFLFSLHYLLYLNFVHPNFNDERLSQTLCFISEVVWALLKVLRPYSVALIAVFRFIAVFSSLLIKQRVIDYFKLCYCLLCHNTYIYRLKIFV